ncbi:hypothetical protein CRUP_016011 [Coryphaenoides rupestris]|nr:hypothetical protein CRUP_016011 [Coryphaenoides rupestris]
MRKLSTRNMKPVKVMRFGASQVGKICGGREGREAEASDVAPSRSTGNRKGPSRNRSSNNIIIIIVIIDPMVTDVQLAIFANMLGVSLFLLVVLYHYVAVNNPKKLE